MKRVIRLNEESLKNLIKEAFKDLTTVDSDYNGYEKAKFLGRTDDSSSNNLDMDFDKPDDAKKELEKLIARALNIKQIRGCEDSKILEGHNFNVYLDVFPQGRYHRGMLTISRGGCGYSRLVVAELVMETSTILAQGTEFCDYCDRDYAKEVNSWTSEMLRKLGYRQNG